MGVTGGMVDNYCQVRILPTVAGEPEDSPNDGGGWWMLSDLVGSEAAEETHDGKTALDEINQLQDQKRVKLLKENRELERLFTEKEERELNTLRVLKEDAEADELRRLKELRLKRKLQLLKELRELRALQAEDDLDRINQLKNKSKSLSKEPTVPELEKDAGNPNNTSPQQDEVNNVPEGKINVDEENQEDTSKANETEPNQYNQDSQAANQLGETERTVVSDQTTCSPKHKPGVHQTHHHKRHHQHKQKKKQEHKLSSNSSEIVEGGGIDEKEGAGAEGGTE